MLLSGECGMRTILIDAFDVWAYTTHRSVYIYAQAYRHEHTHTHTHTYAHR